MSDALHHRRSNRTQRRRRRSVAAWSSWMVWGVAYFASVSAAEPPSARYPLPQRAAPPVPSVRMLQSMSGEQAKAAAAASAAARAIAPEQQLAQSDVPESPLPPPTPSDSDRSLAQPQDDAPLSNGDPWRTTPNDHPPSLAPSVDEVVWWGDQVRSPIRNTAETRLITLEEILVATLRNSAYVRVIKDVPLIRETSIMEADAQFDWTSFVESQWNDVSQPVGSRLTTGGPPRYHDHNVTSRAGVRRRNQLGGQIEVGQRIGYQNTNSIFFTPADQGTSRLTINYTQPLLRNAGRAYNTSLTVLAQIETAAAQDELSRNLQTHLVDVTEAYWQIYLERGNLLQKQRFLRRAEDILAELERRRDIDALVSQIVRARAAVESRRAEIVRSKTDIQNAESRLRTLVNDASLGNVLTHELIPQDRPMAESREIDLAWSVETALQNRPEIGQSIKQIRAAGVRQKVAENEILPQLNGILETYVSGLRGNTDIGGALRDQFSVGEPSYSVGLQYEQPIWNRAAKARYNRRRLELRQLESQLQATAQNVSLEVEVAVREVTTTFQEMQANLGAMQAAEAEVNYIYERWQLLPGSDRNASLLLEDLLDSQQRLNAAEYGYLQAQRNYNISHIAYLRTLGTLLQSEGISLERYCECHLPGFNLNRMGPANTPAFQEREVDLPVDGAPAQVDEDRSALPAAATRR